MFDRYDFAFGLLVVLAAFGTIVYHDGSFISLIPNNRDGIVIDLVIVVVCLVGGSIMSFCARGKLDPNYKA